MRLACCLPLALPLVNVTKPTPHQAIPLKQLSVGQCARIARVVGHPDQVHQLAEFGLRGDENEMFRRGESLHYSSGGSKVCFRADDLLNVLVEPAATH